MGVIGRQGTKLTIVNFLGVGIGVLSTLFLYPKDPALYGLIMFVIATGTLFEPLASMGIQVIVLRYFSRLKADHQSGNGLFAYALLHLSLGILFFFGLFWFENRSCLLTIVGTLFFNTFMVNTMACFRDQ